MSEKHSMEEITERDLELAASTDWEPRKFLPSKSSGEYVFWSDVVSRIGDDRYFNGDFVGDDPARRAKIKLRTAEGKL